MSKGWKEVVEARGAKVVRCKVLPNNGMQDRAVLVVMIDVAAWLSKSL